MSAGAPRRIVVHLPNPLGDAIMAEPAVRALAAAFPAARLTVLVTRTLGALPRAWGVDCDILTLPAPRRLLGHVDQWRVARALRSGGYDLGVLLPNSHLSARLAVRGGVRRRVGYARDGREALLTDPVPFVDRRAHEHMVAYYWALVEAAGGPPLPVAAQLAAAPAETPAILAGDARTRPRLRATPAMRQEAEACLAVHGVAAVPYVAIAPGVGFGEAKRWPVERFAALAARLARRFTGPLVLVGAEADRAVCDEVRRQAPSGTGPLVDLAGRTSLAALVGVIAGARAFVGNDAGAAHVAAALGIPGVAVFGSTSPVHSGPVSPTLRVVRHALPCAPCFQPVCPLEHLACLRGIEPDEVLAALDGGPLA